jgi:ubiquinone/menaquinone biosynthesis C-methylase UbiE
MNTEDLQAYRKYIADTYDARSGNYDRSEWHRKTALRLVEGLPPRTGDSVLDIATGTGTIAFHAASLVGPNGKVVGIDLSEGMLAQAKAKVSASDLRNLEFILADAENLGFPPGSFDRMYCASAFFCILDPIPSWRLCMRYPRTLTTLLRCTSWHGEPHMKVSFRRNTSRPSRS